MALVKVKKINNDSIEYKNVQKEDLLHFEALGWQVVKADEINEEKPAVKASKRGKKREEAEEIIEE